ncbi:hypothetical protein DJ93_5157 [Bacillus clarus]|uniref:Uncharacterized protein n=1 Tax=Bacillus clarus TaxID=2338372 RepID=A0A090YYQ2_9BACI|nr:hypothetical protein DJ93_5157 [Bacillus clarus]
MVRVAPLVIAIVLMGYTMYSWNNDSKQSMLIIQLLLGFMVGGNRDTNL